MSTRESFIDAFNIFLSTYKDGKYLSQLGELMLGDDRYLKVEFLDFYDFSPEQAMQLFKPRFELSLASTAATEKMRVYGVVGEYDPIFVSWVNLPHTKRIRKLDKGCFGILTQIKGSILRVVSPESVPVECVYKCIECGETINRTQTGRWFNAPDVCPSCEKRRFELDPMLTTYRKRQTITIAEGYDDGGMSDMPRSLDCYLWDSLSDVINAGDRVQLVGVLTPQQVQKNDPEMRMEPIFVVNSVIAANREDDGNHFTESEIMEFKTKAAENGFIDNLAKCISPSIYGNLEVKKAIVLELIGGVEKRIGGDKKRGEIHILLTGDAGTGKTTLIRAAAQLSPRGIFTTGMGSTRAGLTASVSKDKDEGWVLDAGAMVLASGGLMAVDEFDKMRAEDRGAMHTAMESGVVPINKAGINTTLNARTAVLAACNPKLGKYNVNETLLKNLSDFPETLLSRFDGIFIFLDEGNKESDTKKALHVDMSMRQPELTNSIYSEKWMKRLFAYAKTLKPTIPEIVGKQLVDYYVDMRQAGRDAGNAVAITQRQQEALYRFTEASAKIHLREAATLDDADNAISIIGYSLKQVGVDPTTGSPDINALYSGIPKSIGDKLRQMPALVTKIEKSNVSGQGCFESELREQMIILWKLGYFDADKIIAQAMKEGLLYRTKDGEIKAA